jgi:hypothetical protein
MLNNLLKIRSNIFLIILIFILSTTSVYSKNGRGDLKMNSKVLEHFIKYITGVGMDKIGYKKGTPQYFATNNEGTVSYYYFCPLKYSNNCKDDDWIKVRRECSKRSKDFGGKKCSIFANKRKIVWNSINYKFAKKPSREEVIKALKEYGFIDELTAEMENVETFDKTNPDLIKKIKGLQKLLDQGAITQADFDKAKKKLLSN